MCYKFVSPLKVAARESYSEKLNKKFSGTNGLTVRHVSYLMKKQALNHKSHRKNSSQKVDYNVYHFKWLKIYKAKCLNKNLTIITAYPCIYSTRNLILIAPRIWATAVGHHMHSCLVCGLHLVATWTAVWYVGYRCWPPHAQLFSMWATSGGHMNSCLVCRLPLLATTCTAV